jgi:hypothetical protein
MLKQQLSTARQTSVCSFVLLTIRGKTRQMATELAMCPTPSFNSSPPMAIRNVIITEIGRFNLLHGSVYVATFKQCYWHNIKQVYIYVYILSIHKTGI